MKLKNTKLKLNQLLLLLAANLVLVSCGTYQSAYSSDGIYGDETPTRENRRVIVADDADYEEYEENYFLNKLNDSGYNYNNNDVFTDVNDYNSVDEDYVNDEFNVLKPHSKLILELVKASKDVFSKPIRIECPAFCSYGSEDRIVNVGHLENYLNMIDKSFKVQAFDGAYHEIHNEIEKYRLPYFEFLKESLLSIL